MLLTDVFHHRHFVFNSWTTEIQQIADSIEKYAKDMFSLDESVDVSHPLNSLELAIFYGRKRIGWHRDQIYKNGLFQNAKNSQQENTFTYILVVGNTRPLEMQLFKDIAGKGASEVNSKQRCFYKMFEFKHGALFLLHPQDEKDIFRSFYDEDVRSYFKHRNTGVKSGEMSIGFVFRTASKRKEVFNSSGQLVSIVEEKSLIQRRRQMNAISGNRVRDMNVIKERHLNQFVKGEIKSKDGKSREEMQAYLHELYRRMEDAFSNQSEMSL